MLHRSTEDPRRAQRSATDHDARASRRPHHAIDVLGAVDVAVPDHRDPVHGRHDLGDAVQVDLAAKLLFGRAAVHGDGGDPLGFETAGQLGRDDAIGAPASRTLAVTGTRCRSTARTMRAARRTVESTSHSSSDPPLRLHTLSTGQPMLMSTTTAP